MAGRFHPRRANYKVQITNKQTNKQTERHGGGRFFKRVNNCSTKNMLKRKFGVHFPPISVRIRLCCLSLAGFQNFAFYGFRRRLLVAWGFGVWVLGSEFSRFSLFHCLIDATVINGRRLISRSFLAVAYYKRMVSCQLFSIFVNQSCHIYFLWYQKKFLLFYPYLLSFSVAPEEA